MPKFFRSPEGAASLGGGANIDNSRPSGPSSYSHYAYAQLAHFRGRHNSRHTALSRSLARCQNEDIGYVNWFKLTAGGQESIHPPTHHLLPPPCIPPSPIRRIFDPLAGHATCGSAAGEARELSQQTGPEAWLRSRPAMQRLCQIT